MQGKVNLEMLFCLSENGFSLDEFVLKLKKLYQEDGFSELSRLILMLVQEVLTMRLLAGKCDNPTCSCEDGHFTLNGGYHRSIKTSIGDLSFYWNRVKCTNCENTFVPLKEFLQLDCYQRKSHELEMLVVDAVSKDSYRRAMETLDTIGFVDVHHRTAHNWVMETNCDQIKLSGDVTGRFGSSQVFADGTKYKGIDEKGKPKKGNLKTMLGVDSKGDVFPIGTWSGSSWDDISESLKERKVNFGEESILISDGEKGLAESISEIVNDQQRCHWHLHRDLYHMMWQDGGKVEDSRPFQRRLAGILGIELPGEDFKKVPEKEKDEIKQKVSDAEKAILRLINDLMSKGYEEAADYISNAQKYMFSYVKRWLKLGIICPRASSLIERITRELARRLKKIAYNWSDRGAEKIARIILKKFTDKKSWDQYWKDKMRLKNDVIFLINDCKISSQDLAH